MMSIKIYFNRENVWPITTMPVYGKYTRTQIITTITIMIAWKANLNDSLNENK